MSVAQAFEPWKSYKPPAISCTDGLIGLTLGDGRCLQVSGDASQGVGFDTASSIGYTYSATARAALVLDDASGLAAVFGLRASHTSYSVYSTTGVLVPDGQHLDVNEAFATVGRKDLQARAGLLDSTFDTLGAKADDFDWLTDLGPFDPRYGTTDIALGGLGVQVTSEMANGLSAGAGLEDFGSGGRSGTAVGFLGFDQDDNTRAKLTGLVGGLMDGRIDDWEVDGFAQTQLGVIDLLTSVHADDDGDQQATVAAKLALGQVFVAADAVYQDEGDEFGASAHVGDPNLGPSIGLAGRLLDAEDYLVWQAELRGSVLLLENLKLTADAGLTRSIMHSPYYYDEGLIGYLAAGAIWQPTGYLQLTASYGANSLGGWKAVGTARERF